MNERRMELTIDGRTLEAIGSVIEVTTMTPEMRPDPKWTYLDPEGHGHCWVNGTLPTCEHMYEEWFDADGAERSDSWWECIKCRAVVAPGYEEVPGTGGGFRRFVPGVTVYYLDGVPVTEDEAQAFMAQARTVVRDA